MRRSLPDITGRVRLIDHTEQLAPTVARWVTNTVGAPVPPMEACDLCDGRILTGAPARRFKRWGIPTVELRLHETCFDFYVSLRNQPA